MWEVEGGGGRLYVHWTVDSTVVFSIMDYGRRERREVVVVVERGIHANVIKAQKGLNDRYKSHFLLFVKKYLCIVYFKRPIKFMKQNIPF